jgi:thioredoxin-like negative regulator of GroEL
LDKKVFATPEFQAYARSIVSIDVDASTPEGKPVAERFGIQSYPTMVVMGPDGNEIERFFGFHSASDFVRTIQDYAAGRNTASDLKRQALEAPDNMELAFAAGQALAIRKRGQEALPFLDAVVSRREFHSTGQMPLALLLLGKTVLAEQLKDYPRSEEVLTRLAKEHPTTFHGREALYTIAQNLLEQGRTQEASAFLQENVSLSVDQPLDVYHFATFSLRFRVLMDESIRHVQEACQRNPSALYLRKALADLFVRKGDIPGAIAVLEETVRLSPSDQAAQKMLETLKSARQRTGE